MEYFLIYLLKSSAIATLFYLVYELFLKKETFFKVNRNFLLTGIITSLVFPLISLKNYIILNTTEGSISSYNYLDSVAIAEASQINWIQVMLVAYSIGVVILFMRLLLQLVSLRRMIYGHEIKKINGICFIETNKPIAPFSFFNYIFYNPEDYETKELNAILRHEEAHCLQGHSLDVILAHLFVIFMWINPFSWLYRNKMQQNLEFLADESAINNVTSIRSYQYSLLKVSGNAFYTPLTNNFHNSLIKKRIVMLHKSKSKTIKAFKTLVILPALAVFLFSFNTTDVYLYNEVTPSQTSTLSQKKIELTIDKDTSDEELAKMKKDLAEDGIDFSYTVAHNNNQEIIELSVSMSSDGSDGKKVKGSSSFSNDGEPIEPVTLVLDTDEGNLFFMSGEQSKSKMVHRMSDHAVWVHDGGKDKNIKTVEIEEKNGKKTIRVNGEEITEAELEEMKDADGVHTQKIKIKKMKGDNDGEKDVNVIILKDSDDEDDIEVISEHSGNYFFVDSDGKENMLYIIDGKESSLKAFESLSADDIETINVYKGDKANKKYGKKGKDGVIEIRTKKDK